MRLNLPFYTSYIASGLCNCLSVLPGENEVSGCSVGAVTGGSGMVSFSASCGDKSCVSTRSRSASGVKLLLFRVSRQGALLRRMRC